ncbi:MAG: hypothetical protein HY868_14430 [Chloroflexi bacterium]|nr:hypothetical protein [Chloroflexota bacterium]
MHSRPDSLPRALVLFAIVVALMLVGAMICSVALWGASRIPLKPIIVPPVETGTPTPPSFTALDLWNAALVATYEAGVFPEPDKSRAYRAVIWTMRNRVMNGQGVVNGYSDEQNLLSRYASYQQHRNDAPDPRALEIAFEVLSAATNADDPIHGARNFVDNSYWTGVREQTGARPRIAGKYMDADLQKMVEEDRFMLAVEWRAPPGHPKGALFYGLYFFDQWPPPMPTYPPPTVLPTRTFTPRPTATLTRTPTPTITLTPTPTATPTMTATLPITTRTPTRAPYP